MQKASYYDSPTLFGGYSYGAGANGFGYEGAQQPFQASSHVENDFQRSSCSLQSLSNAQHGKNKELNGSCMRPGLPPEPPGSPNANNNNANNASDSTQPGTGKSVPGKANLGVGISKQIFPWMKESRQNSKQKNGSPSAGSSAGRGEGSSGLLQIQNDEEKKVKKKEIDGRSLRVVKGRRNRFREGPNSAFVTQNSKERSKNLKELEESV